MEKPSSERKPQTTFSAGGGITAKIATEEAANILNVYLDINCRRNAPNGSATANINGQRDHSDPIGIHERRQRSVVGASGDTQPKSEEFDVVDAGLDTSRRSGQSDGLSTLESNSPSIGIYHGEDVEGNGVHASEPRKKKWTDVFRRKKKTKPSPSKQTEKKRDPLRTGTASTHDQTLDRPVSSALTSPNRSSALPSPNSPRLQQVAVRVGSTGIVQVIPRPVADDYVPKVTSMSIGAHHGPSSSPPSKAPPQNIGTQVDRQSNAQYGISNQVRRSLAPMAHFDDDFIPPEGLSSEKSYNDIDSPGSKASWQRQYSRMESGDLVTDSGKDEPDHPGSKSEAEKKKDYVRVADDLKRMGDELGSSTRSTITSLGGSIFSSLVKNTLNYSHFSELVTQAVEKQPLGTQFLILCNLTAKVVNLAADVAIQADECIQAMTVEYFAENMSAQIANAGGLATVLKNTSTGV